MPSPNPDERLRPPGSRPGPGLVRFVGREDDQALLDADWDTVVSGKLRVVLLTGEPGVGKTRSCEGWTSTMSGD
jgi:hypothetical protein